MGRVYLRCKEEIWYELFPEVRFCITIGTDELSPGTDWQNKFQNTYVDVKSVELRGLLREVLKDVSGVGLREEKPTVSGGILMS